MYYNKYLILSLQLNPEFLNDLEEIDISDYKDNDSYELVRHPAVKNVKYYPCCEEPYPDLTFTAVFKKRRTTMWSK